MSREHSHQRATNIEISELVLSWDTFLMLLIFAAITAALFPLFSDLYAEVVGIATQSIFLELIVLIIGIGLALSMRYFKLARLRAIEKDE